VRVLLIKEVGWFLFKKKKKLFRVLCGSVYLLGCGVRVVMAEVEEKKRKVKVVKICNQWK